MPISPRTLRLQAQEIDRKPVDLTTREKNCRDRILATGGALLARNGTHSVTIADLAIGLNIPAAVIRRHFATMDGLLAELLLLHLQQVSRAIGNVAFSDPNAHQARRAAYFAATHTHGGAFTDLHWLLLRDRRMLSGEDRAAIEIVRDQIGQVMAGDLAEIAFHLLDSECLGLAAIEASLAATKANIDATRHADNAATISAAQKRAATASAERGTCAATPPPLRPQIIYAQPHARPPEPSPLSRVTWTPSLPPLHTGPTLTKAPLLIKSTQRAQAPPEKLRA